MQTPFKIFGPGLDPIIWNLIATFIVFVYIMVIIKIMDIAVTKGFPQDVSRKIVHMAAGSWIIFWPIFDGSHWSYTFNILVAVLWTLMFIQKGLKGSPDDQAVKTMTRTGDPKELLRGPLFFTLAMEFIGIFLYMDIKGVVAMAALGWGDGLAPLFGKYYGAKKYSIFGNEKSLQGSLAMFFFAFIASIIFSLIIVPKAILGNFMMFIVDLLIIAIIATIVEAISPRDVDNLLIPTVLIIVSMFVFNNYTFVIP
ncbi:MAG: diacylglycerol/polyprenol kinase family protein [Candidatus Njordarchaeia archaeon]